MTDETPDPYCSVENEGDEPDALLANADFDIEETNKKEDTSK